MSGTVGNWIKELCTTVGAGDLVLAGTDGGFTKFVDAVPAGLVWYTIVDGNNREAGLGTFDGVSKIVRTTVHATLVAGVYDNTTPTKISLSGVSTVSCTFNTAAYLESMDHTALGNIGSNAHTVIDAHIADSTRHFQEGDIAHGNIQNVGTNTHAQLDTHVADATKHFTEGSIDHTNIQNVGTNTHAQIDTHIADATKHFTEASIDHTNIANVGTNTHAQIDTHVADGSVHLTQATNDARYAQLAAANTFAAHTNFKTAAFDSEVNTDAVSGTTVVDWSDSGKQKLSLGQTTNFMAFVNPPGNKVCNVVLRVVNAGSFVVTGWDTDIRWLGGGFPPVLTVGGVDILTFYFDGSEYHGGIGLNSV